MVNGSDRPRIFDSTLSRRISPALAVCVRPSRNAEIVSPANVLIFIVSPFLYVRACVASMGIGGPLQLVNQLRFLSLGQKRRRQTVLCEGGDLYARQAKRLGAGGIVLQQIAAEVSGVVGIEGDPDTAPQHSRKIVLGQILDHAQFQV